MVPRSVLALERCFNRVNPLTRRRHGSSTPPILLLAVRGLITVSVLCQTAAHIIRFCMYKACKLDRR